MNFNKGKPSFEEFRLSRTNFNNVKTDNCFITEGFIEKETENNSGIVFILFKWINESNFCNLIPIVKVPFTYTNNLINPTFEDFLLVANDTINIATSFSNEELLNREILIEPKRVKSLDLKDNVKLSNIIFKYLV